MNSARRHLVRSLLTACTLATCLATPGQSSAPVPASAGDIGVELAELAGIRPEGRLRKLHLVRPDLIPYPIAYEVYC